MNFSYCPTCGRKNTVEQQDATNYECANCGWHFWNNAKAAVALIFLKDNLMLFGKRGIEPKKGLYDVPGGFVDFGEDAYAAAIREAEEELGVTLLRKDLKLIETYHDRYNPEVSTVDLVFLVRKWSGKITPGSDVTQVAWKPLTFLDDPLFAQEYYNGLHAMLRAHLTAPFTDEF